MGDVSDAYHVGATHVPSASRLAGVAPPAAAYHHVTVAL